MEEEHERVWAQPLVYTGSGVCFPVAWGIEPVRKEFSQNESKPSAFNNLPASAAQLPKYSVQHPNLPDNPGIHQFDGRRWYCSTVINYPGTIEHAARPGRASAFILNR